MNKDAVKIGRLNIWLVLGIALFFRTLLPISGYLYTRDASIFYTPDSASYIVPAHELITYHRFFSDGSPPARGSNSAIVPAPEIIRTPGYPLLLMAGLLMGRLELVTIALQVLHSCFTVYLVYRTAGLLFESEPIALIAASLYAIEPLSILFSSLLSTETLFTAIVMVGVYYLVRYLKRQSLVDLLVSAGALAASVYVRPIGYFLPLVIAAGLAAWVLVIHQQNQLRVLAHTCAFVIVSVGLTSLWQIRNKIETGYSGFSAIASDNMYFVGAASVLAAQQHVPYYGMRDRLGYQDQRIYFREHPDQRYWSVAQRIDYMNRAADHILLGSSLTYTRIYLEGILRATFDPGSTEFIRYFDLYPKQGGLLTVEVDKGTFATLEALFANPLLFWSTAMMLPLLLTCLWCACTTLCSRVIRDPAILAVLFVMGYYMAIAGGPGDWGRFRHPAMPVICLLAAYSLCRKSIEGRPRVTSLAATDPVDQFDDNSMQPRSMRLPLLESEE
jgi:Dolichyl-phosphate-mannose-protein mannosyltransferase